MSVFKDKSLLITGGTGSFGNAVLHLAWRNGFVHNAETHLGDLPNHFSNLLEIIGIL